MKNLIIFFFIFILFSIVSAKSQTVIDTPTGYTADDAGNYAKKFGKKFLNVNSWFNNSQNYSFSIVSWDVVKFPKGGIDYRVFINISWTEVDGFSKYNYLYTGALVFDQFGCDAMFVVSKRTEPHFLSAGVRTYDIPSNSIENFKKICTDAQWFYAPDGCLDD